MLNTYKQIYRKIKQFDKIVIARHIGADPDALASQLALRDSIKNTFPKKKVYAVGCPASKFKYLGSLDKFVDDIYEDALLIVTDTPDYKRVDGVDAKKFKYSIKIDHHPFVEKYCNLEYIDDTASSASQLIMELIFNTKLKLTKEVAEKLYIGLVSDTNRFLFSYTTAKTFALVSKLINETNLNFSPLYEALYTRPIREVRFEGYITNNMKITDNGLAYIKLNDEILSEYGVDSATAGNMVNNFNYIEEILAWVVFSEDKVNNTIRGSIRSRGPIINETAAKFGGGGHMFASGIRLKEQSQVENIILALDEVCKKYKEENNL
ncbi:MAG: bifunctional oligoribonuclease/PAP phosphatase NrnA [Firmicutes bacterium]|nr:bifunctional oligoribonuclease/PAP phosphatase NrnA [Bacillota bacterium]